MFLPEIAFRVKGPNLRIPAPQRVKAAQLYECRAHKIAPTRAAPSDNGKSQSPQDKICVKWIYNDRADFRQCALFGATGMYCGDCFSLSAR